MTDLKFYTFLSKEFEFRRSRNPRYSLRAYSRDLKIAAPKLSQILKGKAGISPAKAQSLVKTLQLDPSEAKLFVTLVAARHSRSETAKKQAQAHLKTILASAEYGALELETFKVISDWYHLAILELTEVRGFKSTLDFISKRLRITMEKAKEAVKRLEDLGLMKKQNSHWVQTHADMATPSGIPSQVIRDYHRQILTKAQEALENVPIPERDFSAITMTIAESQVKEAQEEIKKFRRTLTQQLTSQKDPKERVYCLSVQFFPLDHKESQ